MKWMRLSIVTVSLLQMTVAQARILDSTYSPNLLSVQTTSIFDGDPVDGLFPTMPGDAKGGVIIGIGQPPVTPGTPGTPGNGTVPGTGTTPVAPSPTTPGKMPVANVKEAFKCNLFENSELADILSSVNALNQAVNSPSCAGSDVNVQGIINNNQAIVTALKAIQDVLQSTQDPSNPTTTPSADPGTVSLDPIIQDSAKTTVVINNVDLAIRAAAGLAKSFASSDLMKKECRDTMNNGEIAVAISNIVNGLTPYALMASSLTGGTAAIPWIVGGTVLTSTISSIGKIVTENSFNIKDASTRRALVENTCAFIRMDQKYKFLIQNRGAQTTRITDEIKASQFLFSTTMRGLSKEANELMVRKAQLSQASYDIDSKINPANAQLALDKQFITGTTDDIKICQIGIQLALFTRDSNSYVSNLLGSVDVAANAYGSASQAQVRALKFSANIAVNSLSQMADQRFTINSNFSQCAKVTKSLVETLEQSGALAKRLVNAAHQSVNAELMKNKEYAQIQSQLKVLEQKQALANNVTSSLENLRSYATKFTQSEIDAEMDRLRAGLFGARSMIFDSPVMSWFNYTQLLHKAAVTSFKEGMRSLRLRTFAMTDSGKAGRSPSAALNGNTAQYGKDDMDAFNLALLNQQNLPVGSRAHTDACREMNDVWSRWVVAIDHLSAMESLCGMINPYIYDNRTDDRFLVTMCRGISKSMPGGMETPSTLETLKNTLMKEKSSDWSQYLKQKIDVLNCPQTEAN
jgi:hypothetical protein